MIRDFTTSCILAALAVHGGVQATMGDRQHSAQFFAYAASQNKHYSSKEEYEERMAIWAKNHKKVQVMNETHEGV